MTYPNSMMMQKGVSVVKPEDIEAYLLKKEVLKTEALQKELAIKEAAIK
jgi:hypothetical protein